MNAPKRADTQRDKHFFKRSSRMSLLKTKDAKKNNFSQDREQLVTLSEARAAFEEERRKKNNEYQRSHL
ncbi:hypothetical protein [Candidatus Enterovibrio escicola]|uniref:hypothetical protein n=1 Tax=Candidatus Enterovibrio escicola TaxID=1927127 RepID=UPI001237B39F|nr:hypothetical protein [Candidatus Enterovibrio escacola]